MPNDFGGNKKVGRWLLYGPEQRFIAWALPKIPPWISSYHLTMASIPISLLIVLFGYLAGTYGMEWLWPISLLIFLQWLTDSLDGALGKMRKEGLIKWGYYMDHLLDYFFMSAVLISYMFVIPSQSKLVHFAVLAIGAGFMVNSYLGFAATNEFRISYYRIGPTEARIVLVVINTLIIFFGKTYMSFALPYVLAIGAIALIAAVWQTHRMLWRMDMDAKSKGDPYA